MLATLSSAVATQLGTDPLKFEGIRFRAVTAVGVTADLRLDAFAMRAGAFEAGEGDIEGLASLLVHKPPRDGPTESKNRLYSNSQSWREDFAKRRRSRR